MTGTPTLPSRPGFMVRGKKPEANLRRDYRKTLWVSSAVSAGLHAAVFVLFPSFDVKAYDKSQAPAIIELEQIPETRQERKPPPPIRPVVPIASDSPDVPDDATIEMTELDLYDLPPPPAAVDFGEEVELEEEDEIVEIWKVEKQPVPTKKVKPDYPDIARKAGIEDNVTVLVLVNRQGKVENVGRISGNEIFHAAARAAALQWKFEPAIQNDKPVKVWVSLPFKFEFR